jgi:hypothetical protein
MEYLLELFSPCVVLHVIVAEFDICNCALVWTALGRLPLHWAIERLLPLPTLLCIDDANPTDGAYVSDHQGTRTVTHPWRL